jgi:acyl-phosphate glycerol 3-phosphate acyltransferase
MVVAILILTSYLLGSIPTAVWYGKRFFKIDVREHGSGNAGATNTLRVLGNKAGFIVLFIDLLKGFIATNLAYFSNFDIPCKGTVFFIELPTTSANFLFFLKMSEFRNGEKISYQF